MRDIRTNKTNPAKTHDLARRKRKLQTCNEVEVFGCKFVKYRDSCTGDYDVDTVDTDVTRTGVAYQRVIAASSITNYTAIECSMQFDMAVQPTATLPELTDSPVPPSYAYSWNSPAIHIIGESERLLH